MKKVLLVRNVEASWIDRDINIMSNKFDLHDLFVKNIFQSLRFQNIKKIKESNVLIFWFGSIHFIFLTLLARLLNRPYIVISGGYDAASLPEINYGAFSKKGFTTFIRRIIFHHATKVICVSKSNMKDTLTNVLLSQDVCNLVYHGFNEFDQEIKNWNSRKNQIVMLSRATKSTYLLKGIDKFVEIAKRMPDFSFVLVGGYDDFVFQKVKSANISNFKLLGFIDFNSGQFNDLLGESKFITMLSMYESFGCAIVDGALRGCYPVAFANYALKEVVEKIGTLVNDSDLDALEKVFREISESNISPEDISKKAYERFPIHNRSKGLEEVICSVLGDGVE